MRKYKSKYRVVLLLQEKDIKEKEEEIAKLTNNKNKLLKRLEREKKGIEMFKEELSKGGPINSSFFMGTTDFELQKKLSYEINLINEQIKEKNLEYAKLIKKKDKMLELDKKSEKEFYREIEKREMREIEEHQLILREIERGDGNAD